MKRLIVGLTAAALLLAATVGVAGAADDGDPGGDTTAPAPDARDGRLDCARRHRIAHRGLGAAADALGVDAETVRGELRDGRSVAEIAAARREGDRPGRCEVRRALRRGLLAAAARALGLEPDELRDQLRDGKSVAQVAEARGVALDDVVRAMVAAAGERIDRAVEQGVVGEARAEQLKDRAGTAVQRLVRRVPRHGAAAGG